MENTLNNYENNSLAYYLQQLLGDKMTLDLLRRFRIGTPSWWPGATILWHITIQGEVRSGKMVLLDPMTGKPSQHPDYRPVQVHKFLNLPRFHAQPCLFGEHQLNDRPKDTVAIVANPVTAIIGAAFCPNYVWLSSDGVNNFEVFRCQALTGRNLVMYPELSKDGRTFKNWNRRAKDFSRSLNCQVCVSSHLEDNASEIERTAGLDIADFLVREGKFPKGDESNVAQQDDAVSATASSIQPLNSVTAS